MLASPLLSGAEASSSLGASALSASCGSPSSAGAACSGATTARGLQGSPALGAAGVRTTRIQGTCSRFSSTAMKKPPVSCRCGRIRMLRAKMTHTTYTIRATPRLKYEYKHVNTTRYNTVQCTQRTISLNAVSRRFQAQEENAIHECFYIEYISDRPLQVSSTK